MIRCESCETDHDYALVYARFSANYNTYFDLECGCGAVIEVEVEAIPEFHAVRTRLPAHPRGEQRP